MKKLTVKHFLNKKLKTNSNGSYPIYVRVIYNRQNTNFRSEITRLAVATENEFNNKKEIIRDKEYESELITSIVSFGYNTLGDKFTISRIYNIIPKWKECLTDMFEDIFLKKSKLGSQLVKYFKKGVKVKINTLNEIIGIPSLTVDALYDLAKNKVFDLDINNHILYLYILDQFSIENYGDNAWKYGSDNTFNYYEWLDKDMKSKFLVYAYKSPLLDNEIITGITEKFDKSLKSNLLDFIKFNQEYFTSTLRND